MDGEAECYSAAKDKTKGSEGNPRYFFAYNAEERIYEAG